MSAEPFPSMHGLPYRGGRLRWVDGAERYPKGKSAWRCSWCGKVGPWQDGWGGYWSLRQEDDGLYADDARGYPVWCSPGCYEYVLASGACSEAQQPVVVRRPR